MLYLLSCYAINSRSHFKMYVVSFSAFQACAQHNIILKEGSQVFLDNMYLAKHRTKILRNFPSS